MINSRFLWLNTYDGEIVDATRGYQVRELNGRVDGFE